MERPHRDVDVSIPRSDVAQLCAHLAGRYDVWSADVTTFRLLHTDDCEPAPTCENLWLRAGAAHPWELDVILMHTTSTTWTYKRDARIRRPLDEILWTRDGVTYLRPEVQLLHKARAPRPKDDADLEACLPRLDEPSRSWLVDALSTAHPRHPWIARL